jgi:hypothetical protein
VIPTSSTQAAASGSALDAAGHLLAATGHAMPTLERAREVADIVQQLTGDPQLATAVLVHMARQGTPDEPTLNAAQRAELGSDGQAG